MSKHITQIADRYTADILAEFETEEWHTPHIVIFFATSRPDPTVQVSRWVTNDYTLLAPPLIKPGDKLLDMATYTDDLQAQFDEYFGIDAAQQHFDTIAEWEASWDGDEPHPLEWHDVFAGER